MSFWEQVKTFLAIEPMQERSSPFLEVPSLDDQVARIMRVQSLARPWRNPSISDALGVPAIQRAVTLIANAAGSLAIEGYRNGQLMAEAPMVVTRPDPFSTPRDFYRDATYQMATQGETVWWIASTDPTTGKASALIVVPLGELAIEENTDNRLYPTYRWGNVERHAVQRGQPVRALRPCHLPQGAGSAPRHGAAPDGRSGRLGRGRGPGWAANFYGDGGHASTLIRSALDLDDAEAATLKNQWLNVPNNVPRVVGPSIESVTESDLNEAGAQMLNSRDHQNGEAARLFGIPGALMEYGAPGSSLTYQNLADVWVNFVRGSLTVNYLEPMEQALSDLLPRSIVARFATRGLQRADEKTRWDIYTAAVAVIGQDEAAMMARQREGLVAGDVELAPVPYSPVSAIPSRIPSQLRSAPEDIRCTSWRMRSGRMQPCGKLLSKSGTFVGRCPRCQADYAAA